MKEAGRCGIDLGLNRIIFIISESVSYCLHSFVYRMSENSKNVFHMSVVRFFRCHILSKQQSKTNMADYSQEKTFLYSSRFNLLVFVMTADVCTVAT